MVVEVIYLTWTEENLGAKLARFRMDLASVFEERGKETLRATLRDDPENFWYLVHRTLSKDEAMRLGPNPSDADLD